MLQQTQAARVVAPYAASWPASPPPSACAGRGPRAPCSGLGGPRLQPSGPPPAPGGRGHRRAPRRSSPRRPRGPAGAARRRGLHGAGRARLRLRAPRGRGGRQRRARLVPGPWPGAPCRAAAAQALADALVAAGSGLGVEPGPDGDRRRACARRARRRARGVRWRVVRLVRRRGGSSPTRRRRRSRQTRFEGSDRQGRGRLVDALRSGPVPAADGRAPPAVGPTIPSGPGAWRMPSWPRAWPAVDRGNVLGLP